MPQYIDRPPDGRMNAQGPMALEARRAYEKQQKSGGQEYQIELKAIRDQGLPPDQYRKKVAVLRGKHSLKAHQMQQDWNQKMAMIQQYEKLGAAGTISTEEATRSQYALSGYKIPKQSDPKRPDYWTEHRNLIQERERIQQYKFGNWEKKGFRGRKGYYEVLGVNKDGKVTDWGRKATKEDLADIAGIDDRIAELDTYELSLMQRMDPQQRKVNQLSRAMAMGPRTQNTLGVGGGRGGLPLGDTKGKSGYDFSGGYLTPAVKTKPERLETQGYKMTREKAVQQATSQLGAGASKERVLALAKQIYGVE